MRCDHLTRPETLPPAVDGVDAIVFTHGSDGRGKAGTERIDYGAVRNGLAAPDGRSVRIALMTASVLAAVTANYNRRTEAHNWKRRGERLVRVSGLPYTIVRSFSCNRSFGSHVNSEASGLLAHLAIYCGWPNAVSALEVYDQVYAARKVDTTTLGFAGQRLPPPASDAARVNAGHRRRGRLYRDHARILEEAGLTHGIAVTAAVLSRCGNVVDGHIGYCGSTMSRRTRLSRGRRFP